MVFEYLCKENSAGDLGTLYQLKARLNRKDVHAKINKSYHGTESFFNHEVLAQVPQIQKMAMVCLTTLTTS